MALDRQFWALVAAAMRCATGVWFFVGSHQLEGRYPRDCRRGTAKSSS